MTVSLNVVMYLFICTDFQIAIFSMLTWMQWYRGQISNHTFNTPASFEIKKAWNRWKDSNASCFGDKGEISPVLCNQGRKS